MARLLVIEWTDTTIRLHEPGGTCPHVISTAPDPGLERWEIPGEPVRFRMGSAWMTREQLVSSRLEPWRGCAAAVLAADAAPARAILSAAGIRIVAEEPPGDPVAAGARCAAAFEAEEERRRRRELPIAVGIETLGGLFEALVPAGAELPASATEVFAAADPRQTHLAINLSAGLHDIAGFNAPLGSLKVPLPRRGRAILSLDVGEDRVARLSLRVDPGGAQAGLAADLAPLLEPQAVAAQADSAQRRAGEHRALRQLLEERQLALPLLHAVERALRAVGSLVDDTDRAVIEHQADGLRAALAGDELAPLRAARERLDAASRPLAAAVAHREALARMAQQP